MSAVFTASRTFSRVETDRAIRISRETNDVDRTSAISAGQRRGIFAGSRDSTTSSTIDSPRAIESPYDVSVRETESNFCFFFFTNIPHGSGHDRRKLRTLE